MRSRAKTFWRRSIGPSSHVLLAVSLLTPMIDAEPRDPSVPQVVIVGAPPGAAPMARVDAQRSGRARTELPTTPHVVWRLRLSGIIRDLAVGDRGSVAITTADGRLVEVNAAGRIESTERLGAAVLAGPALTSNGARIVVTTNGTALAVRPSGSILWSRNISAQTASSAPSPLPDDTGGVVVGFSDRVVRFEHDGEVTASATLSEPVRALTNGAGSMYVIGDLGTVFRWNPPDMPTALGRYSGAPSGEVAFVGTSLISAVNRQRLESISVDSGARRVMFEGAVSESIVVLPSQKEIAVATFDGLLLRSNLSSATMTTTLLGAGVAGFGKAASITTNLLAITDNSGTVTVAAARGVASLPAKGPSTWVELAECGEPVALVPHSRKQILVACQSGLVMLLGNA